MESMLERLRRMSRHVVRLFQRCWGKSLNKLRLLFREPKLKKSVQYREATDFMDEYIDKLDMEFLNTEAGREAQKLAYERAEMEHADAEAAQKSLEAKAQEVIKVSSAFVGGFAVLTNFSSGGVGGTGLDGDKWRWACAGLVSFLIATFLAFMCLRAHPYIAVVRSKELFKILANSEDRERFLIRAAMLGHRNAEASRDLNDALATRIQAAWFLVTLGLFFVVMSVLAH